ncbi:uncharacterized protein NECHADRAFT_82054 [Fusarium vanettenii 77-13-4]|uniref:Helicase C-terminal domain-containing protein n=1 Tax=Fusarium vanettenii (strain ATCC MYA-4622 / CBS 123669 / FGSC 9596 / NRRL 45880 / 77-13-4) TaxID=660122 RepID=C7ZAC8_FUSV7|nr:uncharacterized protein NECHADRAFT_82054 [Fusarium vanettenii 77-13-4]EEU39252.1 hypothetical protein NECHADRAFT_82054 [Fusarium vanettenii 77-13-4]
MDPFSFLSGTMPPHLMESYMICRYQSEASLPSIKAEGHRLLIYIKDTACAREAHDMLQRAGFNTFDFSDPGHSRRERASGLAKFNDPGNSEFDVLITSYRRGAGRGNFHGACRRGLIVELPDDIQTLYKARQSLDHIGQTEPARWITMYINHSYDAHDEFQLAQQEARMIIEAPELHQSLSTDFTVPRIDERITGEHRLICAFEILQQIQLTGFSKYPRARMSWEEMDMPEAKLEGQFYAAVGRFLMANPTTTDKFTKETMEGIALRWEPGKELTMDRVVGNCPALPNGVKIYTCVKPGKGRGML